jgi:hypothetical protein
VQVACRIGPWRRFAEPADLSHGPDTGNNGRAILPRSSAKKVPVCSRVYMRLPLPTRLLRNRVCNNRAALNPITGLISFMFLSILLSSVTPKKRQKDLLTET